MTAPRSRPANSESQRPSLEEVLYERFYEFDFFQAVRVLERLDPHHYVVGRDFPPSQEVVRFRSHPSLIFPPSALAGLQPLSEKANGTRVAPRLTVAFMGLTGPSATLPRFYTETIIERLRQKDRTLYDFLDLFHHRLVSLFYRAWQKYRPTSRFEEAEMLGLRDYQDTPSRRRSFLVDVRPRIDKASQVLLDLGGLGIPSLRLGATHPDAVIPRTTIADDTLRFYAGLFGNDHRPASGLEQLLREHFAVPVEVQQCVGQWLLIEREDQSQLQRLSQTTLGANAVVGERFRDLQGRFRLRVGPVTYQLYRQFMPNGNRFREVADMARLYAGMEFDIDLQLVLQQAEVPQLQLNSQSPSPPQLGWNTWVHSGKTHRDRDDAVLNLVATAELQSA